MRGVFSGFVLANLWRVVGTGWRVVQAGVSIFESGGSRNFAVKTTNGILQQTLFHKKGKKKGSATKETGVDDGF